MPSEAQLTSGRLQSLRGLAALVVLIHHSLRTVPDGATTWFVSEHILNAHAAVVVFFVLSGYVLALSLIRRGLGVGSVVPYYVRRIFRIYPALIVGVTLGAIYVVTWAYWPRANLSPWAYSILRQGQFSPGALLASMSGLGTDLLPPLWTIKVELVASAILPVLVLILLRGVVGTLSLMAVLLGLSFVAHASVPLYMVHFAIGAALATVLKDIQLPAPGWIAILSAAFLLFFRASWPWGYHAPFPSLMEGVAGGVLVMAITNGGAKVLELKPLQKIGDWSYGIYLFHLPIAFGLARWISSGSLRPDVQALVVTAVTLAVTVPFSWLVFRCIESPGISIGHKFSDYMASRMMMWGGKLAAVRARRPETKVELSE